MLLSYLKSLKRLMLFGIVADFDLKSVAWSVSPFIVAISAFVEYSRTLISRPDLFSDRKKLLPLHLRQMHYEFSKASCDFLSCLLICFTISLAKSKAECSKIEFIFLLIFWISRRYPKGQTKMNFLIYFVLNKK